MLSKVKKRTIFYHITVILQYCWDKTIARSGDMYRDYLGILTLVIKCFDITNTSVQNFAIRISSVKNVLKCLRKLKVLRYRCIISIDVFTPCDSHLSKIFRISCDIVSNLSFCTFTYYDALYSVNKVKIYWNIWSMKGHCIWSCPSMSCNILERETSYSLTRYPYQS